MVQNRPASRKKGRAKQVRDMYNSARDTDPGVAFSTHHYIILIQYLVVQTKSKSRSDGIDPLTAAGLHRWLDLDSAMTAKKVRFNYAHAMENVVF